MSLLLGVDVDKTFLILFVVCILGICVTSCGLRYVTGDGIPYSKVVDILSIFITNELYYIFKSYDIITK